MKTIKEIMLSLSEYAVVSEDDTLLDALLALDRAQIKLPPNRQPHQAVLVKDKNGKIVGKLGHLGFLKALEPKYAVLGDVKRLSNSGLSSEFIESMMENYRFWQDKPTEVRNRARHLKIKLVMRPVEESIDEDSTLAEAIHSIVMWQTLSVLVTRDDKVIGILRLTDLFKEISNYIKSSD
jgi:hypothetical protein